MTSAIEHWQQEAAAGRTDGTRDLIARDLEDNAIEAALKSLPVKRTKNLRVVELGCGAGRIAARCAPFVRSWQGVDSSPGMVAASARQGLTNAVFEVGEAGQWLVHRIRQTDPVADVVITQRVLINLQTWPEQLSTINLIAAVLRPGGYYLMCENSMDGFAAIKLQRAALGLPDIAWPSHNRYLSSQELREVKGLRLERCEQFSATYYFLSRIVQPALLEPGQEPDYEAPINELARRLPAFGPFAQGRLWIWRKP
jgi:SAM-dependent methyltransferase